MKIIVSSKKKKFNNLIQIYREYTIYSTVCGKTKSHTTLLSITILHFQYYTDGIRDNNMK